MIRINDNFHRLAPTYLFTEVARRLKAYATANPDVDIIRMGIGDVTCPICPAAVEAMKKAADDQSDPSTFHGYGPEQGYEWLRRAIAEGDYMSRGVNVDIDEIFVSDGAKSDTGNIGDIISTECRVAVTDPVYPVYVDTNVMAGRAGTPTPDGCWSRISYLPCIAENAFIPALPTDSPDVIYLCYPNNPTGTTLTRDELARWVEYARAHGSLILFDSAYEAYITSPDVPHSIYEIEGAREVAIEFRSFSKTAGFTGLRCGYTVVPKELKGVAEDGTIVSLNSLWLRRQSTKFNGASYIIQRAAEALYTPEGRRQVADTIAYYMRNARILREGLEQMGLHVWGGIDAPYIWLRTPDSMSSWEFFDFLLDHCHVAGTPGSGFGPSGEGYFRLTAFGRYEDTVRAVDRMRQLSVNE
ncbi:LL-diaminopimelate aminotransferase [Muribaculum intestinale]|uniref:LL-diaminopimelate aminotransferase n=1 Tax=Muribaculum intestinale TaxID=1796646 RepID=UPI0025A986D1|nr:LL-diaminopimelate aminotransferase [Muribaculum intestinale]